MDSGTVTSATDVDGTIHENGFGYQPALDGIRALAVLGVMAYHDAYGWAKGGFLGVDAFFVLSGFLITTLLILEWRRAQRIAFVAFWGRRIRRLLPALLLVIVFVSIYSWVAVPSLQLNRVRGDGIAGLFYVANWRFVATGTSYFDLFSSPSPFRHLWSLAIEEQFYLVWPLVVFACLKIARGRLRVLVGFCVVGTVASVWLMSALYDADDPSRAYFGTDSRADTILVGCLLAILLLQWRPTARQARIAVQVLGVIGALAVIWAWHDVSDIERGYYGIGSLIYAVAVAAVIAAAVQPGRGLIRTPLSWKPLRWIGTISYGLYLWHWPIDVWIVEWRTGLGPTALNLLRFGVTFAFAVASYYLVELPVRRGSFLGIRRPNLRWVAPAGIVLVGVTLLISTAGATDAPLFGNNDHPYACPQAGQVKTAERALKRSGGTAHLPKDRGLRVTLVGDSVACSLWVGTKVVGGAAGWKTAQGVVVGCGIAAGEVAAGAARIPPGTSVCPDLTAANVDAALKQRHPDVVLWVSTWERASLKVGDRTLEAGTPAWARALQRRMDRALRKLTRSGAHVVVTSQAPAVASEFTHPTDAELDAAGQAFGRMNAELLKFAARHPKQVTFVDLANRICPGGPPCPEKVDGMEPRGIDGTHLTPQSAVWAMRWLVPFVEEAGGKSQSGT